MLDNEDELDAEAYARDTDPVEVDMEEVHIPRNLSRDDHTDSANEEGAASVVVDVEALSLAHA